VAEKLSKQWQMKKAEIIISGNITNGVIFQRDGENQRMAAASSPNEKTEAAVSISVFIPAPLSVNKKARQNERRQ